MNPPATQTNTIPAPDLISPDMAGAIYLGTFKPAAGGKVPVLDKASMEVLFDGASGNAAGVAEAARTAKAAQGAWAALPPTARGDVLRKFASLCEQHVNEISGWIVRESGEWHYTTSLGSLARDLRKPAFQPSNGTRAGGSRELIRTVASGGTPRGASRLSCTPVTSLSAGSLAVGPTFT